jgi:2-polyprenyl-3-methyl-5-hydroxy-6-metoxy-1,4-benzoquinol methylase
MSYKWLIKNDSMNDSERQQYWEDIHSEHNYENVWSVTEDEALRDKFVNEIQNFTHDKILIVGCGSKSYLQEDLIQKIPTIQKIVCTDFPKVIKIPKEENCYEKIEYMAKDSKDLGWANEWDVVIIVNSILSEDDIENRLILKECQKALKNGGVLVGIFPTIFCPIDIGYLDKSTSFLEDADIMTNTLIEKKQNTKQIFYTPLRLRYVLKEAKFKIEKFEVYFFDSPYFLEHSCEYYNIQENDVVVYEHFIVAEK